MSEPLKLGDEVAVEAPLHPFHGTVGKISRIVMNARGTEYDVWPLSRDCRGVTFTADQLQRADANEGEPNG